MTSFINSESKTMFKANYQSRNFSFEAYGETEKVAIASLKLGLKNHAKQYDIPPNWWKEYGEEIYTNEIALGSSYRDNEKIPQY
jgi:hypothetical protein